MGFVIVVGIIIYIILGIREKMADIDSENYIEKLKNERNKFNRWVNNIIDIDLEEELQLFIYNHPEEAIEKAKSLCPFIPVVKDMDTIYLRSMTFPHFSTVLSLSGDTHILVCFKSGFRCQQEPFPMA